VHPEKQPHQSRSTEEGMQIDESDEQFPNAYSPIETSFERHSNMTEAREEQWWKQCTPMLSTEEGMQMAESDKHS
jgi:hypothetical protein